MSKILNLVKKELEKVFKNPRAILTNFILPGLLIYLVYSILGNVMASTAKDVQSSHIKVAVVNSSQVFDNAFNAYKDAFNKASKGKLNYEFKSVDLGVDDFTRIINYDNIPDKTSDETRIYNEIKSNIENEKFDAYICFNKDFDQKYSQGKQSIVGVFGKNTLDKSAFALNTINTVIESMQPKIVANIAKDFSSENELSASLLANLIPLFLLIFIFSGSMSVCGDSIAGEKERGTISTLLMTPIKRSHIIYGKIISLVIITIVYAIGPFIAVITSIPQLLKGTGVSINIGLSVLSGSSIAQIFMLVLISSLLATSIFLLISTISKSVKEAGIISAPILMIVVVLSTITSSLNIGDNLGFFFVPFMNIALGINQAIMGSLTAVESTCICISTVLYCVILIAFSIKLFNNEKILYSK